MNDAAFTFPSRADIPISKLKELGATLEDNWKWAWTTDAEDDRRRAVQLLRKRLEEELPANDSIYQSRF